MMVADAKTKSARRQIRELREQQELAYLKRANARRMQEDTMDQWLGPYLELIQRETRDWAPIGVLGRQSRKGGKDFPVFRNEIDLRLLRSAARIICATNIYAIGLLEGLTSYVIGCGFTYKGVADNDKYPGMAEGIQTRVDKFLNRNQFGGNDTADMAFADADYDAGEQPSFEEELFKRWRVDGEAIALSTYNPDGTTDVRFIEPDQLVQPPGRQFVDCPAYVGDTNGGDFNQWGFGIYTLPEDTQNPLAYYIQWGDSSSQGKIYYPNEVTFIRANSWRTVKRGVTDFCFDVADTFRLGTLLRGNIGEGAAQRATIVGVTQNPVGTKAEIQGYNDADGDYTRERFGSNSGTFDWVKRYTAGRWEDMTGGKEYVQGPGAGNDQYHLMVLQGILRAAAVRWNATEWLTSGDSSQNSFANSLTANSQFVIGTKRAQKTPRFACGKIVLRAVLHAIKTAGKLECEYVRDGVTMTATYSLQDVIRGGSINVEVPKPDAADPYKDAQMYDILLNHKIVDPATVSSKLGYDPETVSKGWAKFRDENPGVDPPLQLPMGDAFNGR